MRGKIDWLKDYRAQTGCGLHQAMAAYDTMALAMCDTEALRNAAALAALPAIIQTEQQTTPREGETPAQMFARFAFEMSDAFIAAREGKET